MRPFLREKIIFINKAVIPLESEDCTNNKFWGRKEKRTTIYNHSACLLSDVPIAEYYSSKSFNIHYIKKLLEYFFIQELGK